MFEIDEILNKEKSKFFAEILNRLREGNHTENDIMKIKKRCVDVKDYPREAPGLFIQNVMVDCYKETVYQSSMGTKYNIKSQDSTIAANSAGIGDTIMK